MEGKTSSGFKYVIDEKALDDWELFEWLTEVDSGNVTYIIKVAKRLLGEKQYEALKNHLRDSEGRLSLTLMSGAIEEIMNASEEAKK